MKPDKQIRKNKNDQICSYKANAGHDLPIFYKGSIIRIGEGAAVEIDKNFLGFEAKHQLANALEKKYIFEIGEDT